MRKNTSSKALSFLFLALFIALSAAAQPGADPFRGPLANPAGTLESTVDLQFDPSTHPFFKAYGPNGRSCVTCHQPGDAYAISARGVQERFFATNGQDPVFRPVDGSNCKGDDPAALPERQKAYSMLLNKAVIRLETELPAGAEFELIGTDDPHHCAPTGKLPIFRRPLPLTNMRFLSALGWDGRGTKIAPTLPEGMMMIAVGATLGHGEAAAPPPPAELKQMLDFMLAIHSAQATDARAGDLLADGAQGGALKVRDQNFFIGINDPLDPSVQFDSRAFQVFTAWADGGKNPASPEQAEARASIARGEKLFTTRSFEITGVRGLNDVIKQPSLRATCTTCHNTPGMGNHSVSLPIDIGVADEAHRTPDLPLFSLRCKTDGRIIKTTDPGKALGSGKCDDIGKFKGPTLRALSARAPYFHNGFAASLKDVVNFYNSRFGIGFSEQEKSDLAAFLGAL